MQNCEKKVRIIRYTSAIARKKSELWDKKSTLFLVCGGNNKKIVLQNVKKEKVWFVTNSELWEKVIIVGIAKISQNC